jgi:hypothetical protein
MERIARRERVKPAKRLAQKTSLRSVLIKNEKLRMKNIRVEHMFRSYFIFLISYFIGGYNNISRKQKKVTGVGEKIKKNEKI